MSPYEKRIYFLTGIIAVITAVYAGFAAAQWCAMREANKLTRRLLEASSRPIVVARGSDPDKCVCTFLENAGRDSAFASVRKRAIFSTTRLFSGPPLPTTKEHMLVAAGVGHAIEYPKPGLSPLPTQKGWFYLSARITYGKNYFTRYCVEYAVTPPTQTEEACEDPNTNNAN